MFSIFFSKNHAVYEKNWENMIEADIPHITI